ncbi:MAG: chloride channel protein [Pedosphaera sp.]|nr:chloride channel protein [Pedosphaera sp.]
MSGVTGRWFVLQFQKLPSRTRAIVLTGLIGLAAGGAAVAFQVCVNRVYRLSLVKLSHHSFEVFLGGSFLVIMSTALISGLLMNAFCREAAGSGIPQLKVAFWKDFGYVPWRAVWVKFVAGVLSIGGGSSLGREGPSVYLAGGLASNLAGSLGEAKQNRRPAAAAGAAAGLAAAFNTPLAAITFVLEEIIEDLNSRFLGSILLASVIGALVVHGLVGKQPAFKLGNIDAPGWPVYLLTPLVAAVAALTGAVFQVLTLKLRAKQKRSAWLPAWLRPGVGALVVWVLGVAVFAATGRLGVFGLGYEDLTAGLNNDLPWKLAGILLVAKLLATVAAYGFGGCGGVFSPTLFFGGMCGVFIGGVAGAVWHLGPADQTTLAVVGMSGCLGAVVRAPVTGILIVFEMTHQFSLVPALMLGALISQAVARKVTQDSLYDALLLQDGHKLEHVIPPRDLQSWQQLPVSAIANFHPVIIEDLAADPLRETLRVNPHSRFPVMREGRLLGMLTRKEAEVALVESRAPKLEMTVTCLPDQTIRNLQRLLIESSTHLVILLDEPKGKVLGLVTLHDLLRAEVSIAESGNV